MSTDLLDPEVLFAEDHGACCDCCAGYCPQYDAGEADGWPTIWVLEANGVEYVSDRYFMVRQDAVAPLPEKVMENAQRLAMSPQFAVVPVKKPKRVAGPQSANFLDRLDRSGLTMHAGDEKIVHLYRGPQHVGWLTLAKGRLVCDPADLPLVRRLADDVGLTIPEAHAALRIARGGES